MKYLPIDVWRMSASRPWQLSSTHPHLVKHLKYRGALRYHLIESVLVEDLSNNCINFAKENGYEIHVIRPAKGQGEAMDYAIKRVITTKYALKWEDDFQPEMDIPLTKCVELMEMYPHINQICFNKRKTLQYKRMSQWNEETQKCEVFEWEKEQRYFELNGKQYPLVVKDRWWFGAAIWRMDFIKPLFRVFLNDTHNQMNDQVLMPMAGFVYGDEAHGFVGRKQPTAKAIEENVGCYIWGKTKDPRMVFHAGLGDSLYYGDVQKRWREEGRKVLG